jgi:hypothetical protein
MDGELMPYTRFVERDGKVDVYKKEGGHEVLAFTSHSPSKEVAHRTAAIRESHAGGGKRSGGKRRVRRS